MVAMQKEDLAEGQLRSREATVGRKPMAKRWPDEQKPHRRTHRMRGQLSLKSKVCTEDVSVYVAGISVKAGESYLGRSGDMPERARTVGTRCEVSAEVSRGHSNPRSGGKGRT